MNLIKNIFLLIAVFGVIACKSRRSNEDKKEKPNIVLIMADDLGIGDVGVYGQEIFSTPNVDQLVSEGMKFTNFYAGSTVCAPSRATLLTGQHTGHTKVRGNGEFPLDPVKKIIPEMLKEEGYTNAMFGKWGLGLEGSSGSPEKRGWDEFIGHLHHIDAHFQQPDSLDKIVNGRMVKIGTPKGSYANEIFTDAAVDFIKASSKENPFFLYLSFTIPHAELGVPQKFLEDHLTPNKRSKYEPEEAWPAGRHYGEQKFPKAAYAAMVESMDSYVGEILMTLENQGYDENTIVIFTSDNGTHLEGGRQQKDVDFFKSSGPYKGVKRDLYEGGIRMPFIVKWPGVVKAESTSDFKGAFWDIYPTLANIAGVEVKEEIDGLSFLPALRGEKEQKQHEYLYWEFHEFGGKQAILKDDWKLIELDKNKESSRFELYNIDKDPQEHKNLAQEYPDRVESLSQLMDSIRTTNENFQFQ